MFRKFHENQQSRSKPTYPQQIRHYHTISYINIHYFFARFSTEPCSNDYAECKHGLRIVKPAGCHEASRQAHCEAFLLCIFLRSDASILGSPADLQIRSTRLMTPTLIWQTRTFRMQSRMPWMNFGASHQKLTYSDLVPRDTLRYPVLCFWWEI